MSKKIFSTVVVSTKEARDYLKDKLEKADAKELEIIMEAVFPFLIYNKEIVVVEDKNNLAKDVFESFDELCSK